VHLGDLPGCRLEDYHVLALIGGFSNGDHLGAGTVQASLFRHRLREPLQSFVQSGRLVIGICNGFQTLVKMGLLPGADWSAPLRSWQTTPAATKTAGCAWRPTRPRPASGRGPAAPVPAGAPRGGKFVVRDMAAALSLRRRAQIALRYADGQGRPTQEYPANPNGSADAVAGVCDPSGRIFGLMPHPEPTFPPATIRPGRARRPGPAPPRRRRGCGPVPQRRGLPARRGLAS